MEMKGVIGVIYRPPDMDINTFNDQFATVMENIEQEKKICYLTGDYNLNLLKRMVQQVISMILCTAIDLFPL